MTESRKKYQPAVDFVRLLYGHDVIPLHRPVLAGNAKRYLEECIDSNCVSSVGIRVNDFERQVAEFTGSRYAVATVNGTAALHVALNLLNVRQSDEVLTQSLNFVATCNTISYVKACPVFIDVDRDTMGMSPWALEGFLSDNVERRKEGSFNRLTGRRLAACVPMHTFGHPCRIQEIVSICDSHGIPVIEDAAESLGSYVGKHHTGTFGRLATLSFNGNKVITTGGGGMIITDDEVLARRAKHVSTTAKVPHAYEFVHDEVGYNYRLPNLNAALGCAQMENLTQMLAIKAEIAARYETFFRGSGIQYMAAPEGTTPNYWLNTICLESEAERDEFLHYTNSRGVLTRPIWRLMSRLEMFKDCQHDGLANSRWLEARVVNLPSSVPDSEFGRLQ